MLFGFLSKIVGAVYRIPLTSIIGAEGMGLYQMVFPLYTLMLTVSSSGLPSSISKLISENIAKNNYKQADRILKVSFILLVCFSIFCSLLVVLFSSSFAKIQGNKDALICYIGLAPAIVFVGFISGFRGYFQGLQQMTPSAISGFIEQVVKMALGLYFSAVFIKKGLSYGVFGAMLGISISELVACLYLFVTYLFSRKKIKPLIVNNKGELLGKKKTVFKILSLSIFVTLGGLIMPLSMLIDSVVVINILKGVGFSQSLSTTLFGLQTGTVGSIINMPVVLSLGVSTAILPCVSSCVAKKDSKGTKKASSKALLLTLLIALPAAVGVYTFSEPIIRILYGKSLGAFEIKVASKILEVASFGIFYLAMVQVSAGILQGISKFYVPLVSLALGAIVKIVLNLILLRIETVNIIGAEFSSVVCYMVALLINLAVLKKYNIVKLDYKIFIVLLINGLIIYAKDLFKMFLKINLNYYLSFFMSVFIVVLMYFILIAILYRDLIKLKKKTNMKN